MKLLILEGTSTSGKTTLANILNEGFRRSGRNAYLVKEDKTLMPVLRSSSPAVHIDHINKIITTISKEKYDFVITDRLHLTSAAVCDMSKTDFEKIEDSLLKFDPVIIFLEIDSDKLGDRIFEAMKHRGPSWNDHVTSKGTRKDIASWYLKTQEKLLSRLKSSKIRHLKFNATDSKYENIAKDIFGALI